MKHQRNDQKLVDDFNASVPEGSAVIYWTGPRIGPGVESKTRSPAQLLSGHTPVVWVEGHAACIALSHIQVKGNG